MGREAERAIERYWTYMCAIAFRMTFTDKDAEDILQEACVRILRHWGTCRSEEVQTWIGAIVSNLCKHLRRDRRNRPTAPLRAVDGLPAQPGRWDRVNALLGDVAPALRELTPEQREVIENRFLLGRSVKQTALAMQCREGAVRALTFRAISRLRQIVRATEEEDL